MVGGARARRAGGDPSRLPGGGQEEGSSTWRCKECHGWDYKGKDGAYAKGSHYSGTTGVGGVAGTDPEAIHKIIMNDTHGFTERTMPHSAMEKLALFLSRGRAALLVPRPGARAPRA